MKNYRTYMRTTVAILMATVCIYLHASGHKTTADSIESHLTASFVTCWPGSEIYELVGHEALRIRGIDEKGLPVDSIWNYGVFDFNEPNFVYRFVKGETDYMVAGYPFEWFMPEYVKRGSKVAEQDLNLTQRQVRRLRSNMQRASLPQNRTYRYNYIRDNCSTRVADRLHDIASDSIVYTGSPRFKSFRDAMRHYHRNYPWYQFGIDLVLGPGLDGKYEVSDELFAPVELHDIMDKAQYADGSKVVGESRILYAGREDAVLPPTPWYLTPMSAAVLMLLISLGICLREGKTLKIAKLWMTLYWSLCGLVGVIIFFLYFFSVHEATSPNLLILWLNPLQLIVPLTIWSRRTQPAVTVMMWLNIIITGITLIAWPLQSQSANPAIFPLMATDLLLAATWIIVTGKNKPQDIKTTKKPLKRKAPKKRAK